MTWKSSSCKSIRPPSRTVRPLPRRDRRVRTPTRSHARALASRAVRVSPRVRARCECEGVAAPLSR
eukprot:31267-Pelagococcus_subviridis.AAC.12